MNENEKIKKCKHLTITFSHVICLMAISQACCKRHRRQKNRERERLSQRDRNTERQKDRETERQREREIERQRDALELEVSLII